MSFLWLIAPESRLIAGRASASCLSMSANRRVHAVPRRWHELGVAFAERSEFEEEEMLLSIQNWRLRTGSKMRFAFCPPPLQPSLKQAASACSCCAGWSFASKRALANADLLAVERLTRIFRTGLPDGYCKKP